MAAKGPFVLDPLVLFRSALYAARGGFLVRPFVIALTLGITGMVLSTLEEEVPSIDRFVPHLLFPTHGDPQVAQAILSNVATSIMTVVAIVFAILLMSLTLASTQFSPRILVSFVRDRVTQWTLGVFLGTFSYCIAALPAAHTYPSAFEPILTVAGAMLLATISAGWLIYFIHHISTAISVNHIVDRIRRETETIIDELAPRPRQPSSPAEDAEAHPPLDLPIASRQTGYIRFVDIERLRRLARHDQICLRLERRVGQFVPQGAPLLRVSRRDHLSENDLLQLLAAIDIGPARTMQQDVEFGIVQIVDIGLKAISPAVNDPTTTITCVDQLSAILIRWMEREPPASIYCDPPREPRVVIPWVTFEGLCDLAFEQICHYAAADAAVSLRLMRAFGDIADAVAESAVRERLTARGSRLVDACRGRLRDEDLGRLERRFVRLKSAQAA